MRKLILGLVLIHLGAPELRAQRLSERAAMVSRASRETALQQTPIRVAELEDHRTSGMKGGGLAGALVLGVVGAYMGYTAMDSCGEGMCELGGIIGGFLVGEVVGVPLGVRMAGGRGSLPAQVLMSGGVLALGLLAVPVTGGLSLLAVVPIQIEAVVRNAKGDTTRTVMPTR